MPRSSRDVDKLVSKRPGRSVGVALDELRSLTERTGRLAKALFGAIDADVVIVRDGKVWRSHERTEHIDPDLKIAMGGDDVVWIADTDDHPGWPRSDQASDLDGIRFFAAVPIRLKSGFSLGALRVFDSRPRAFDENLAARLQELASFVAEEYDRLLTYEMWMFRELFEQSPSFMAVLNGPNHIVELVNPAFIALVGLRPLSGLPIRTAAPELAEQGTVALLDEVIKTGRVHVGQDVSFVLERTRGKPEEVFADFVLQPIFDVTGKVSSILFQGNDITQEKRALDELRASQTKLEAALAANQAIFDNSLDVICTINDQGLFTQVSKHAADVWGYSAQELTGRPFMDLVHPGDKAATEATHAQILDGRQTVGFQNRFVHKDGAVIPVMWSAAWSERHKTVVAIGRDMRESLAKEERLRRAQKMEAIGRLTGGIAHDFNNLLTIIVGGAEVLMETLEPASEAQDIAKLVFSAGERGADLVSRLLTFSRAQPLDPLPIGVHGLFSALEPLVRRTIGENIQVHFQAERDLACLADRNQLESALLNLAINARDAMPNGGILKIEASAYHVTGLNGAGGIPPGQYVQLSVKDTGQGMDSKTLERATDPFFTTKDVGKGTGLGLAMAYGFATQSGGAMRIRSALGKGTTVDILLPVTSHPAPLEPTAETPTPQAGKANILVVEDDEMVRAHIVRMLRSMRYDVVESENGARALEILERRESLDLLLTDVVMPGGMNGFQLANQARRFRPDLKVLFTSGYAENQLQDADETYSEEEILRKPYRREDLARRVADALAKDLAV
jgi:PAS domain S-box-containing protein